MTDILLGVDKTSEDVSDKTFGRVVSVLARDHHWCKADEVELCVNVSRRVSQQTLELNVEMNQQTSRDHLHVVVMIGCHDGNG